MDASKRLVNIDMFDVGRCHKGDREREVERQLLACDLNQYEHL